jgi:hypothetical protein
VTISEHVRQWVEPTSMWYTIVISQQPTRTSQRFTTKNHLNSRARAQTIGDPQLHDNPTTRQIERYDVAPRVVLWDSWGWRLDGERATLAALLDGRIASPFGIDSPLSVRLCVGRGRGVCHVFFLYIVVVVVVVVLRALSLFFDCHVVFVSIVGRAVQRA